MNTKIDKRKIPFIGNLCFIRVLKWKTKVGLQNIAIPAFRCVPAIARIGYTIVFFKPLDIQQIQKEFKIKYCMYWFRQYLM